MKQAKRKRKIHQHQLSSSTSRRNIETLINDLDSSKGPGTDGLNIKVLKYCSSIISPHLTKLFNRCIDEGVYPSCFKTAKCVPIYKGGCLDKEDPVNYRPISILNALNKVFEKALKPVRKLWERMRGK